jgi:hypothetical protein
VAIVEVLGRGAGVIAVVALTGKDKNHLAGTGEFAGLTGNMFSNAADDLSFGLAGGPSGSFPFAHLSDADDWNRHGGERGKIFFGTKEECRDKGVNNS